MLCSKGSEGSRLVRGNTNDVPAVDIETTAPHPSIGNKGQREGEVRSELVIIAHDTTLTCTKGQKHVCEK